MSYKIRLNDKATIDDIRTIMNMMDLVHDGKNTEHVIILKSREGVDLVEVVAQNANRIPLTLIPNDPEVAPQTPFLNDPVAFPQTLVIDDTENEATID